MGEKTYEKLLKEILNSKKDGYDDLYIYKDKNKNSVPYDWYELKEIKAKELSITIEDVMRKFKPEELIEAIGIEKVETLIRAHKIKLIKNKIKK